MRNAAQSSSGSLGSGSSSSEEDNNITKKRKRSTDVSILLKVFPKLSERPFTQNEIELLKCLCELEYMNVSTLDPLNQFFKEFVPQSLKTTKERPVVVEPELPMTTILEQDVPKISVNSEYLSFNLNEILRVTEETPLAQLKEKVKCFYLTVDLGVNFFEKIANEVSKKSSLSSLMNFYFTITKKQRTAKFIYLVATILASSSYLRVVHEKADVLPKNQKKDLWSILELFMLGKVSKGVASAKSAKQYLNKKIKLTKSEQRILKGGNNLLLLCAYFSPGILFGADLSVSFFYDFPPMDLIDFFKQYPQEKKEKLDKKIRKLGSFFEADVAKIQNAIGEDMINEFKKLIFPPTE